MDRTWTLPAMVVGACVALEGFGLVRSGGEASNDGVRRYVLGDITGEHRVAQTLTLRADGFSSIAIRPRVDAEGATGTASLTLHDVTSRDAPALVQQADVPLGSLAAARTFELRFAPQPSRGRVYELELRVHDVPHGHAVGLLATRGNTYPHGSLSVNDEPRHWSDLVFETSVDDALSNFSVIAARLSDTGVPFAAVALLLALLFKNAALLLVLRAAALHGIAAPCRAQALGDSARRTASSQTSSGSGTSRSASPTSARAP